MSESEEEADKGLLGACFSLKDGSMWQVVEPLSELKYQRNISPFEARQVFTCVLRKDPAHRYTGIQEAVVKVKYQIRGTQDTISEYEDDIRMWALAVEESPDNERFADNLADAQEGLRAAIEPRYTPHCYTINEVQALKHLTAEGCAYTPQFLGFTLYTVDDEIDEIAMPGGYIAFLVMTKLPGRSKSYDYEYWKLPRLLVKPSPPGAMLNIGRNVWALGIDPRDRATRNIMWDEESKKCYIVDFEDYEVIDLEKPEEMPSFGDWVYQSWGLAAIPTAIGTSVGAAEAIRQQDVLDEEAESDERQHPFHLDVYCDAQSRKRDEVHGSMVVLKDGKLRLWPQDPKTKLPKPHPDGSPAPHPFTGFYYPFPVDELPNRPIPAVPVLGLVSTVPPDPKHSFSSNSRSGKPKLNWVYVDKHTREVRYGPRTEARQHIIGPWDWTEEDEQGLTLGGEESLVVVEEEKGGYGWAIYYDQEDNRLKKYEVGKTKRVLRCSLERRVIDEEDVV
ncbi:uncharacterized protein EI97DRAFT_373854 [Westerdykella ornata]|uniref:Uncharacterized protein n=1 Tax=Westerdykella ornata TaxID=318751 RepID=A0A6A6JPP3_WESOR|nr:uncharacterized protein EI97DRAFT_373854 [Westerdykella ornata]KAF2277878.1 hypothetical protein EI97DRAFT_373854 [Westerdykella ornata]